MQRVIKIAPAIFLVTSAILFLLAPMAKAETASTVYEVPYTKVDVPLTPASVVVYPNNSTEDRVITSDEYNFKSSFLLVFDKDGRLLQIGTNLMEGASYENQAIIPPGGFCVAFTGNSRLTRFYNTALDGGMLYNKMVKTYVKLYGKLLENKIVLTIPNPKPESPDAFKVLFVGNSATYFNSVPSQFKELVRASGQNVIADQCTVGAAHLSWFADPKHSAHQTLQRMLSKKNYDLVVLQDFSGATYEQSLVSLQTLQPMITAKGAKMMLYMFYPTPTRSAEEFSDIYTRLGKALNVQVSPVAMVYDYAIKSHPEINLYFKDNKHSSEAGSYLIACTLFASIYDTSPVGNTFYGAVDKTTAETLQKIVHEVLFK